MPRGGEREGEREVIRKEYTKTGVAKRERKKKKNRKNPASSACRTVRVSEGCPKHFSAGGCNKLAGPVCVYRRTAARVINTFHTRASSAPRFLSPILFSAGGPLSLAAAAAARGVVAGLGSVPDPFLGNAASVKDKSGAGAALVGLPLPFAHPLSLSRL